METESTNLEQEVSGLPMFVGDYLHALDPKKRLTIPSVWRSQVGSPKSLYVLPDVHYRCLLVLPATAMMRRLEAMSRHSMADRTARDFARVLGEASDLLSWDTQGRIRIKDKLLNFAELTDQVLLIGALDRFELWNPKNRTGGGELDQNSLSEAARYVGF